MPTQTCPIVLASGLTLADPWALIRRMREEPDWYPVYDGAPEFFDDDLGPCEITLSIMLGSGIRSDEATNLFVKAASDPLVPCLLRRLRGVELQEAKYEHLAAFAELIERLRVEGVALSTLSKILHKKRPHFIPVLDTEVQYYYLRDALRKGFPGRWKGRTEPKEAMTVLWLMQGDLVHSSREIECLRQQLESSGMKFTRCRLLSHLIWEHGQRASGGSAKVFKSVPG